MISLKLVNCKPLVDFKKLNFEVQAIMILNCSDKNCLNLINHDNINTALFLNDSKILLDLVFKSFSELNLLLRKLHYSEIRCSYYILLDKIPLVKNEELLKVKNE